MKLSKVILPEIVMGQRGHLEIIAFYKNHMNNLKLQLNGEGRPGILIPQKFLEYLDENAIHHFWLAKRFKEMGGKTYYVPKDFSQALAEIDRPLPIEYFPKTFWAWIQFADGSISDDAGNVEGGFVFMGPAKLVGLSKDGVSYDPEMGALQVSYVNSSPDGDGMVGCIQKFSTDLRKETLAELTAAVSNVDYLGGRNMQTAMPSDAVQAQRNRVLRALVNAALYISSSEPELMKLRPLGEMSHGKRVEYKKTHPVDNLCTIPITLVNWPYEGQRQRHVDSSFVQTHMRWQPCGVGNTKVKLIWVKEHNRHYKKEEKHDN